jgi:hypothetical protein
MPHDASRARRLRLIQGYRQDDYPPPRAYDAGLRARFAIVLDAYRPAAEGMLFDVELFLQLVGALLEAVPHDRVVFEVAEDRRIDALRQLEATYTGASLVGLEPPDQIVLLRDEKPVCVLETECRVDVGGPEPYHDAYTLALYTQADLAPGFRAVCERVGAALGATLTGYDQGARQREPYVALWKRPLRWVGMKGW